VRISLPAGAWIDLDQDWLRASLDEVPAAFSWEQREIVLFGRRILQPRLIAWGGALPYRYSGQTLEPRPLPPVVARILEDVAARASVPFNHVLANRYRDGNDSMGFHSDDEPELGPDPVVATLSLGATRRLVLKPRHKRDGPPRDVSLAHGSLLVMGGTCQKVFQHGIPRQVGVTAERVSLTFRWLRSAPGERISETSSDPGASEDPLHTRRPP
jgi:alkylated DNA repair dioxygenase AlkB